MIRRSARCCWSVKQDHLKQSGGENTNHFVLNCFSAESVEAVEFSYFPFILENQLKFLSAQGGK